MDSIDRAIIAALQADGRMSNKELAARVGLAPSSCLARVRRLTERGVLVGFHAEVATSALGIGLQALIAVRLGGHSRAIFDAFSARIRELTETAAVYQVGGADDFLIHVAVRDADHLRDLVLDHFLADEHIAHVETSVIFAHHRAPVLPIYV